MRRESALPLALFRILFGACLALDVGGLIRYAPWWFDDVPFVAPTAVPVVPLLAVWLAAAVGLTLGLFTRACAVVSYLACVGFLGFAAMPLAYEYHLDNLYILASFALIFLPVERRLSIDALRKPPATRTVGRGPGVFLALLVASIYFDSAVWKLSSRMWMEGLGYWVPACQPWDVLLSLPWTIENEWVARGLGYVTLVYELLFVVLVWFRRIRIPLLLVGFGLHVGIGTVIPLPLFGMLMIAFLVGLIPLRAPREGGGGAAPGERPGRGPVAVFYAGWAFAFLLGFLEPVGALARYGVGGATGAMPRPWHVTSDGALARAYSRTMTWSYRLFGFRSHPIFLDSQFVDYTVETRLRYQAPGETGEGRRFYGPIRNRMWLAWNYRMVWPLLPRQRVEDWLVRFVTFHAVRDGLDLERGQVVIEQRPIELPVTEWRPGQRERNVGSDWTRVGRITGEPGSVVVLWQEPFWS